MKRSALFAVLLLASATQSFAQPATPGVMTPATAGQVIARGLGAPPLPPVPEHPVGGTDNLSDGDYVIGPTYSPSDEVRLHPDWATGELDEIVMLAQDSKLYPGRRKKVGYVPDSDKAPGGRGNAVPGDIQWQDGPYAPRHVWVYLPAGVSKTTPLPVVIVQDGDLLHDQMRRALDGLIANKRLPPMAMVAVAPQRYPQGSMEVEDGQGSERGYEYDSLSGRYSDFIETEVLPRVARQFGVRFTTDPDGRATLGLSSGAAAAFTMAWTHPERYHRVILYSPTFVNQQSPVDPAEPYGAWEYHAHIIADAPVKPLRVWMEVGEHDNRYDDPDNTFHNWVTAAKRSAAVFKSKGYHYRFEFAKSAIHADPAVIDQTLAAALEYAWQGYKPSGQ